jgi:biofilm PGA synthesis lipoprotein PgaB
LFNLLTPRYSLIRPLLTALLLISITFRVIAANDPPSHLLVLQYHHVSSSTPASTSISPEQFTAHMDWLMNEGYTVIELPLAIEQLQEGRSLDDKTVAITFDDGFIDVYTTAFPILRERKLPFTIFINPDPHDQKLPAWANWKQIKEMGKNGATLANHTNSHLFMLRRADNESTTAWRTRITEEVVVAEERIHSETDQSHLMLAYTYGESDTALRALIGDLGFTAFGQHSGGIDSNSDFTNLPRFPLSGPYSAMDSFQTKMKSLPMQVHTATTDTASKDGTLTHAETTPALTIQLHDSSNLVLNCFASDQGAIPVVDQGEGRYLIRAPKPLPVGRSRYNCTYASEWPGRFYWYSYPWVRLDEGEVWTHK